MDNRVNILLHCIFIDIVDTTFNTQCPNIPFSHSTKDSKTNLFNKCNL